MTKAEVALLLIADHAAPPHREYTLAEANARLKSILKLALDAIHKEDSE